MSTQSVRGPKSGAPPLRIVMYTQWFPPEKAAIPADIAAGLAAQGHDVTVVTGFPNYPLGRTYEGWRQRPWADSAVDGYRIRRVVQYPSHDASAIRRALSYLSFAVAATVFGWRRLRAADVVYVYHPPLTTALGPWLNRATGGAPYVLHVQDLWPDSVVAADLLADRVLSVTARVLDRMCRAVYGRAHAVVCLAPGMAGLLADRGLPRRQLQVVANWTDESVFRPLERDPDVARSLGADGHTTVMFAGNMGPAQGLETAVHAAAAVADLPDFRLLLVGDGLGRAALESLAEELGADNVRFCGSRPFAEMAAVTAAADAQLVTLRGLPFLRGTVPSKVGSVMASGLPVVVSADGDAAALVEQAGAGWTCPAEDVAALAEAFRRVAGSSEEERRRRGEAGRAYYEKNMTRAAGVRRIGRMLEAAAGIESTEKR
ncbi:glycosyltransferase family 4 protein [Blastococcus capsensis]|uniref:glycosyltransferase family 4 protein n=1 Tax=Blastococcus capsensis TaxID=1564163 RepID=UPI0025404627|nr:glycosyltransferase family 4 protein [Blastococcus capsensis]MDK3257135.1 glycosyltransferase family 4 protein [Blastococcus capsensis]